MHQLLYYLLQKDSTNLVDELCHDDENFSRMTAEQLLVMVRCLHESHDLAKRFNSDNELRTSLWRAGVFRQKLDAIA